MLANFFTASQTPWTQPVVTLSPAEQSWVISEAAFALRALGRLADAVDPMRAGAEADVAQDDWKNAAISYNNLSELLLTLGRLSEALSAAQKSIDLANRSGDAFQRMLNRTTLADARHYAGDVTAPPEPSSPKPRASRRRGSPTTPTSIRCKATSTATSCSPRAKPPQSAAVRRRHSHWERASSPSPTSPSPAPAPSHFTLAIDGLRRAGQLHHLPLGLLARGTQHDLDEVYKIATRSGMRLHLTDYHLKQAALDLANGNQAKAREHTQKAADLIQATGYHRRDPDLALLRQQLDPPSAP